MKTVITSKNNPIVKEAAFLKEKKGRVRTGLFFVEGEKMTAECIAAGLEIERVFFAENYAGRFADKIGKALALRGITEEKISYLSEIAFSYLSEEKTPQGVACAVKIPQYAPKSPEGDCLLLDGVADPGNLGTIIRTANAAGYKEIYLVSCADAYSPKCVRSSMSGVFFTKLYDVSKSEALDLVKDVPIIAADMGGENIFSFVTPQKIALAIGNEANGISEEVRKAAKYTVAIPMAGEQESLNAGVAAAVAMYTLRREKFLKIMRF
ncbi:MAG TPA: hypothetical protein DCE65_05020 [Clostridiales bacterium]|nr:hypothetical protein [Clostridiales bacterium]